MSCLRWLFGAWLAATAVLPDAAAEDRGTAAGANRSRPSTPPAATTFRPYVVYPVGSEARALAIADLTGDGRHDVALATSTLQVFAQTPAGTLERIASYPVGGSTVAVGDVNGDGRTDVVVGNSSLIGVFHQNAAGSLDPMVAYPTTQASMVRVGDLNHDGRDDVVGISPGRQDGLVQVFLQNGTGGLDSPTTYLAPPGGWDLAVGDVNGDGLTDIVLLFGGWAFDYALSILYQRAAGGFEPVVHVNLPVGTLGRWGVGIGDLNGDGLADAAVSYGGNRPDTSIARFLQMPGGGFSPPESHASYDLPTALEVADVDGDGRADIVVMHAGWRATGIYFQNVDGSLRAEELFDLPAIQNYYPQGLAIGDLDGNALTDIAHADPYNGLVVLYQNTGVPPGVTIAAPSGDQLYVGVPHDIRWTVSGSAIERVDVFDGHDYWDLFTPNSGCTALPGIATSCTWVPPGPPTSEGRLRVQATDASGNVGAAIAPYALVTPIVTVTQPTPGVEWSIGSSREITWTSNLPITGTVDLDLSRDGGASWSVVAAAVPNSGSYQWTVTGPLTQRAQVRVRWSTAGAVMDSSDKSFRILHHHPRSPLSSTPIH